MRKILVFVLGVIMMFRMNMNTFAGEWIQNSTGWWYDNGNGTWPSSTWQWIDGNRDGRAECYYFDASGYCMVNTTTPDRYQVDSSGAWVVNGVVQIKEMGLQYSPQNIEKDKNRIVIERDIFTTLGQSYRQIKANRWLDEPRRPTLTWPWLVWSEDLRVELFFPVTYLDLDEEISLRAKPLSDEKCYKIQGLIPYVFSGIEEDMSPELFLQRLDFSEWYQIVKREYFIEASYWFQPFSEEEENYQFKLTSDQGIVINVNTSMTSDKKVSWTGAVEVRLD